MKQETLQESLDRLTAVQAKRKLPARIMIIGRAEPYEVNEARLVAYTGEYGMLDLYYELDTPEERLRAHCCRVTRKLWFEGDWPIEGRDGANA